MNHLLSQTPARTSETNSLPLVSKSDDEFTLGSIKDLDELRRTFQRKAHMAAMERACRRLIAGGWTVESLPQARLADVPDSAERASLLRRRSDIGLPLDPDSPVFVDDSGSPVPSEDAAMRLRFARTVRVSIDGNAHFCRGLLTTRYPESAAAQRPRQEDPR